MEHGAVTVYLPGYAQVEWWAVWKRWNEGLVEAYPGRTAISHWHIAYKSTAPHAAPLLTATTHSNGS